MPTIRRPNVPPATVRVTRAAGDAASEAARLVPLRLVGAPPRSQLFVGAATTPTPESAALAGDLTATTREPFAYFYVPAGRQTLRVVAPNGEERTTTADFTFRSTANFLRILGVLAAEFAAGDPVSRARESLRSVGTRGWNESDVQDAYRMDAALSRGTFPAGIVPPLETLATLATEQEVRWPEMTVVSDATATGTGTVVESRTRVTGTVSGTTGFGPDGAPPPPRTGNVRTVTGIGGTGTIGGSIGGGSGATPQPMGTTGGGLRINRPAAPTLRIDGRPPYSVLYVDGSRSDAGSWSNPATFDAWVMPLAAGAHTLRIVPTTGAARTGPATVPATGEATIAWSVMREEPAATPDEPPPPPPPAREEPVVKPEERRDPVATVDDEADKREEPPQDHNTALGRVIVRTSLPNVAAMLQGGPTVSGDMVRAADGTLAASVASGTYQLVAWQEATPMHRTNVRTANVTVSAGNDVTFVYTGAALVPATESAMARVEGPNPWAALVNAGASRTFVLLASIGVRQRDALDDERETLTRQGTIYGAPPAPTGSR